MLKTRVENNTVYQLVSPVLDGANSNNAIEISTNIKNTSNNKNHPLYHLMDDNLETYWRCDSYSPLGSIDFHFSEPTKVNGIYFYSDKSSTLHIYSKWEWQGSHDNANWDTLYVCNKAIASAFIEFDNNTAYEYYRFVALSGSASSYSKIAELALYYSNYQYSVHKTKEENLPIYPINDGVDRVYFTEKGNLYVTNKSGILQKFFNTSTVVDEDIKDNSGIYLKSHKNREVLESIGYTEDTVIYNNNEVGVNHIYPTDGNPVEYEETYKVLVSDNLDEGTLVSNSAITLAIQDIENKIRR